LVTGFGGYMTRWFSVNAPFLMVGCIDITFVVFLVWLAKSGHIEH
jgi:hypothetical protein